MCRGCSLAYFILYIGLSIIQRHGKFHADALQLNYILDSDMDENEYMTRLKMSLILLI